MTAGILHVFRGSIFFSNAGVGQINKNLILEYKAKKQYEPIVLDYMVTSNHIHLRVYDHAGRDVIPKSILLLAGRTGQEYN